MPDSVLDLLLNRGPPALAIVLFAAALGLPIPSTALVLAAGALAREGRVDAPLYAILALIGAVLGDAAGYLLARLGFAPILRRLEGSTSWHRAERAFERWGKLTILFSRFLVTPLSPPVNAIAGAVRYPFAGFFLLCAIGEVVWVALFGGLGYFFAEGWQEIGRIAGDLSLWLAGGAVVALGFYEAYKYWRHRHACTQP
ncbi:MAG: hypothetical protein CYG60_19160 [Actinobacteria bacterium]|nr:MAG: hypothetical protein CYG60_19160 [Actinomycetota bacterium]